MKVQLFVMATMLTCGMAWAQNTPSTPKLTKETVLQELKTGCLQSGNTEKSCECSIKSFDDKLAKEEWDLLLTPPQSITQEDITKFKNVETKMLQVVSDCGATKQ